MKSILVIEDNLEVRENIAEILELADYKVLTAMNGKVGVGLAKQSIPDLIICDVMMPELDGYGVLHLLSKSQETAVIPFIFLTAKTEKSDVRKGMNLGADDYLTKPFDDVELLDAVEIRLRKKELIRSAAVGGDLDSIHKIVSEARGNQELEKLISDQRKISRFKKKQILYSEGNKANSLYFIVSGKLKTYKTNDDGRELITGLYKEGDFLGYMNLLEGSDHTESAMMLDDSEIHIIPKDEFFAVLFSSKDVSEKFIKMLSDNLIEKEERLLKLAYNSVRKRVAESLFMIYSNFHKDEDPSDFTMAIYRDDLAAIAGASKETVIRTLSDFKDEGLISIQGSKISIINLDKLQKMKN
ncbi:response regulator [Cytophaga hutchinsonii]|uniref:Transcriptional regulator n=1 Tax=Cytophaga hutchinsonii (strain ATCC 33406 / DSM 1761 / CIP 103989 / NBRC 15051 / NCIMB 9469 / D465) TaxID=269798 RepID=A0A6N4SQ27_CYTH3|nr:response regulator [Cytophaga hutchinsonii]ABG58407.1 transcriptional regulator [Cytophaga hutchinsonii ATCC 33406]SFX50794.1 transcriptional regulator [Cytophaga hutchinsonii ATCC 33406]